MWRISSGQYACKFHKAAIQNKIQKLERVLLNSCLKKSPHFAFAVNSIEFQAAMELNRGLLVGNSGPHERPTITVGNLMTRERMKWCQ